MGTMEETYDPEVCKSSCNSSSVRTLKKEKVTLGEAYDPEVPTNSCDSSPELEVEENERDVEINTIQNVLAKLWVQKACGKAQQDDVKLKLNFLKEELIRAEKCHESLLMKEIKLKQKLQNLC